MQILAGKMIYTYMLKFRTDISPDLNDPDFTSKCSRNQNKQRNVTLCLVYIFLNECQVSQWKSLYQTNINPVFK